MSLNNEQLEAELISSEVEDDVSLQRENLFDEIKRVEEETLSQLDANKNENQEDIDGIKADILLPKWSTSPKVILAAGSVIKPESTVMNITATVGGGAVTLTSNPSIADGINGQILVLRGSHATDTVTLTDGNGMQLNGSITLATNDTITLYYDAVITNDWIELSRSDNLSLTLSGTYTPTLSNTTNVAASTPRLSSYIRVGDVVTVAGQLDIDPTAGAATLLGISLPIASAFTTVYQLGGVASSTTITNESAGIEADATNDRASLKYVAVDTTNHTMTFTFTYSVI